MDRVSPDLLLMIFKKLNSKEMVSVMRVERKWLQVMDEHKSLWRELVLPSKKKGWGLQALELFDRKSNSTLKRVSMHVAEEVDGGLFVETLEKSKGTLRVLELSYRDYMVREALEENLWKFPNLVDCRLTSPSHWYYTLRLQLLDKIEDQEDDKGSSLRVLWISDSSKLLKSHLYLLHNLVSLVLEDKTHDSSEMRRILKGPSRILKHLEIRIKGGNQQQLPTLSFPSLKFLDIDLYNRPAPVFPSWMSLPSLSTLSIWNSRTLSSLPACSKLWLVGLIEFDNLSELGSQCPELTMNLVPSSGVTSADLLALERFEDLSSMSSQRKANVEAGMEIEGVKMINLKTLVIPFDYVGFREETSWKEVGLSKLRESVEEVVDLREKISESPEIIEMQV